MRLIPSVKLCAVALCLSSTCAVAESAPKAAESKQQAFTYSAQTIRRAEKDRGPLLRKGDLRLWGVPGQPARISSPSLSLSGVLIQIGTKHGVVA